MQTLTLELLESRLNDLRRYIDDELEILRERLIRAEAADAKIRQGLRDDIRQVTNEIQDLDRRFNNLGGR